MALHPFLGEGSEHWPACRPKRYYDMSAKAICFSCTAFGQGLLCLFAYYRPPDRLSAFVTDCLHNVSASPEKRSDREGQLAGGQAKSRQGDIAITAPQAMQTLDACRACMAEVQRPE